MGINHIFNSYILYIPPYTFNSCAMSPTTTSRHLPKTLTPRLLQRKCFPEYRRPLQASQTLECKPRAQEKRKLTSVVKVWRPLQNWVARMKSNIALLSFLGTTCAPELRDAATQTDDICSSTPKKIHRPTPLNISPVMSYASSLSSLGHSDLSYHPTEMSMLDAGLEEDEDDAEENLEE